uniref:Nucleoside diphosphate kinase 6 n=1 Tax=Schistosoma haematobium TaxID=6185 RepID=A0A095CFG3_SCHHA
MSMKQLTLAILKPDVQRFINYRKYVESVMSDAQLQIIHNEEVFMTRDRAQVFYAEHEGNGPLGVYILSGNDAISVWRSLLGPTKVYRTVVFEPNSLRGRFGLTDTRNGFHGSDSQENAFKEIKFFFPNFNCESILSDL